LSVSISDKKSNFIVRGAPPQQIYFILFYFIFVSKLVHILKYKRKMSKQDDHRTDAISFFVSDDYCLLAKDGLYLTINRPDGSMQISNRSPSKSSGSTFTIFGVMGMIHFLSSPYLVVITERELIGPILNGFIWGIKSSRIFPLYNKPVSSLTPEQVLCA